MAELIVIQHVEREGPGLLARAAAVRGWAVRRHHPWRGEPLPDPAEAVGGTRLLVLLGGPMGVGDLGDPRFPWLEAELALLRAWLAADAPVLGICLGAQLLARAGGGDAAPLEFGDPPRRLREVGFGAVDFHADAEREPLLAGLPASLMVLHWHGDRIRLPPAATLLASSLVCPEQIFRIGARAFGLQCHIELEPQALDRWLREDADFVRAALGPGGDARLRGDAARWLPSLQAPWLRLIANLFDQAIAAGPQGTASEPGGVRGTGR